MEKYVFLDFDGVMTSGKNYDTLVSAGRPVRDEYGDLFDPEAVANLQMILENTGASVVISSNWNVLGLGTMKDMWKKRELPGKIAGVAVEGELEDLDLAAMDIDTNMDFLMGQGLRGKAISGWLARNAKAKRQAVLENSQGRCAYCRAPLTLETLTVDHIKPKSSFSGEGEADSIENLCACCKTCNTAKAAMSVKEFRTFVNSRNNELLKLEADRRKAIARAEHLSKEIESRKFEYIHHLRTNVALII